MTDEDRAEIEMRLRLLRRFTWLMGAATAGMWTGTVVFLTIAVMHVYRGTCG